VRTHLDTFADVAGLLDGFFPAGDGGAHTVADSGEPVSRTDDMAPAVLAAVLAELEALNAWTEAEVAAAIRQGGSRAGVKGRALFEPLRRALTGREHGPPLPAVAVVQGQQAVTARLRRALSQ
jgi:glutamyl/glutaminyl-tRNA synthetase